MYIVRPFAPEKPYPTIVDYKWDRVEFSYTGCLVWMVTPQGDVMCFVCIITITDAQHVYPVFGFEKLYADKAKAAISGKLFSYFWIILYFTHALHSRSHLSSSSHSHSSSRIIFNIL